MWSKFYLSYVYLKILQNWTLIINIATVAKLVFTFLRTQIDSKFQLENRLQKGKTIDYLASFLRLCIYTNPFRMAPTIYTAEYNVKRKHKRESLKCFTDRIIWHCWRNDWCVIGTLVKRKWMRGWLTTGAKSPHKLHRKRLLKWKKPTKTESQ